MPLLIKQRKDTKRYLVWLADASHQNYKEYDEVLDILKDLQSEVHKYNILDTLNQTWVTVEDN